MIGRLLDHYAVWDRYTQIVPYKLRHGIRLRRHGSHFPAAYRDLNCVYIHIPKTAGTAVAQAIFGNANIGHAHYTSEDYRLEDPELFAGSFKFAFVRNPWDRLVSSYRYSISPPDWVMDRTREYSQYLNSKCPSFTEFVQGLERSPRLRRWTHNIPQVDFVTSPLGDCQVDFVGKYETLSADLELVSSHLKLSKTPELSQVNVSSGEKNSYADYYCTRTKDIVAKIYREDIDQFEYEFAE